MTRWRYASWNYAGGRDGRPWCPWHDGGRAGVCLCVEGHWWAPVGVDGKGRVRLRWEPRAAYHAWWRSEDVGLGLLQRGCLAHLARVEAEANAAAQAAEELALRLPPPPRFRLRLPGWLARWLRV